MSLILQCFLLLNLIFFSRSNQRCYTIDKEKKNFHEVHRLPLLSIYILI